MKLMILSGIAIFGLSTVSVYAQDSSNTTQSSSSNTQSTTTQSGSQSQVSAKSAKEACEKLVEAAKKDDFKTFQQMSLFHRGHMGKMQDSRGGAAGQVGHGSGRGAMGAGMGGMNPGEMENRFHKMHQEHMTQLKDLSCGTERVAGDHAFVESEAKGEKRLIPFVNLGDGWKFDAGTYMSFYRESMRRDMNAKNKKSG